MAGRAQFGRQEWDPSAADFIVRHLQIFQTEAMNATVGSGERHGDGDDDSAGSDISLLLLYDKGIYFDGIFLNLDRPRGGVPVASENVA